MTPDQDTQNQLVAQQATDTKPVAPILPPAPVPATPVDTSGYSKLATEVKSIFDKMYVAIKKGKAFRLGADEVHNLMLRISSLGEEAEAEIVKEVAKVKTELKINKKVADGIDSTKQESKGTQPTEGTASTDTTIVPPAK